MKEENELILVVDDEERLTSIISTYLERDGYFVEVAQNGREALTIAEQNPPDLIILDIMMPEMDGYKFLEAFRKVSQTPVICLSARIGEDDQVKGLDLGADDYITKPFRPRTLVARVHALLRRVGMNQVQDSGSRLEIGRVVVDRDKHVATVDGKLIELTPTEFDLLATLMASPGRAFSRLDLLEEIQGSRYVGYERTIDIHIKNLRGKIEVDPHHPEFIETIYGVGYRFSEP
jgi:two-component system alkaline phosphatase synthesis response regulator PhoP